MFKLVYIKYPFKTSWLARHLCNIFPQGIVYYCITILSLQKVASKNWATEDKGSSQGGIDRVNKDTKQISSVWCWYHILSEHKDKTTTTTQYPKISNHAERFNSSQKPRHNITQNWRIYSYKKTGPQHTRIVHRMQQSMSQNSSNGSKCVVVCVYE